MKSLNSLFRLGWVLLVLTGLVGCRTQPPPAEGNSNWAQQRQQLEYLQGWQLRGRVNVRYENESHTPRIQWQQQGEEYLIRLWGTFNAGNTRISGGAHRVTLEQKGDVHTASSPEDLILEYLGYELPVSYLRYWVRGLPVADSAAELQFNSLNQLVGFTQEGWIVSYEDLRQYGEVNLPRRVEVSYPEREIRLRFIGLAWNLDDLDDINE